MKKTVPFFVLPLTLLSAAPSIDHTPPSYIISGHRTTLQTTIQSDSGIKLARAYFKASDTAHYNFVDMPCRQKDCEATLPKTTSTTPSVQYQFLFVDHQKKIFKSKPYLVAVDNTRVLPRWQLTSVSGTLAVKTEIPNPPKKVEGFSDDMTYDTVESSARFGTSAGLYSLLGKKGASGTLATTASKSTATAGGMSTNTALWIGGGVALAGGGAALALSAGGGDDGGNGEPSNDTRITLRWSGSNDLDLIVEDPCGNRIYFFVPQAECDGHTGILTQSANAQTPQNNPVEVINFPGGGAAGTYNVYVTDTLNRDDSPTAFTVDVFNQGSTAQANGSVESDAITPVAQFTHQN